MGALLSKVEPDNPVLSAQKRLVRVAVVGCGAVTRQFHLPVLAGHEGVRLAALVDRDQGRAAELAKEYRVETVLEDSGKLDPSWIDAAVVATPPVHHAPCAIELMKRGVHVLVEKPMATCYQDALAMVQTAEKAGTVLAVGLFRRLLPSTRLLKAMLDSDWLGRPLRFDLAGGAVYGWQAATLGNMRKDLAGGGVLMDIGPHVLDHLLYVFGEPAEVLEYRDNSLGGIESDCMVRLRIRHRGEPVEGRIELSRTRKLGGRLRIDCAKGVLQLQTNDRYRVSVKPRDLELVDALRSQPRCYTLEGTWSDEPDAPDYESFRAEIDDWLGAIQSGQAPELSGRSVLPTVKLIEECYRQAQPLHEPWITEGLCQSGSGPASLADEGAVGRSTACLAAGQANGAPRRVLVTGATGFIGCRVAEILRLREGWQVRALVHKPASASRLARIPVEMVQADLGSERDLSHLVKGCDAVVHCAIGTTYGQRREIFSVSVEGTRKLAAAALAAGVRRFVHLSSIAVHGTCVPGIVDESTPVRPTRGDDYSESKALAEEAIRQAVGRGLPAVILRPANVFGPHSLTFVIRPIEALTQGRLVLAGSPDTPSNTVYLDNVVEAIVRALEAPAQIVAGEVFTIGQGDEFTCGEYYGYFAKALGLTVPVVSPEELDEVQAGRGGWHPLRWIGACWHGGVQIATSAEMRALAHKFLQTDPLGRLPRYLLQRFPVLRRRLGRLLKTDSAVCYRRPTSDQEDLVQLRPRRVTLSIQKAQRVLGYAPVVSRERAMELTLDWLRYARII